MQFADVLCYIILAVTVTASCVNAEEHSTDVEELQTERRIHKRDATVLLDYPMDRIFQKPKVIYRRISKQRYGPPKSKYGPPRPKYRPPKVTRKPGRKNKGKPKTRLSSPKYGPPEPKIKQSSHSKAKKRASKPKPKYGHPNSRPYNRPGFGHVVKMPHYSYYVPDKTSFGEPPIPHMREFNHQQKPSYGEPPVDSYGAPLKPSIKDVYSTPETLLETSQHYDAGDYNVNEHLWNSKLIQKPDTNYAFTKKQPIYSIPSKPVYVTPTPKELSEENLVSDVTEKQIMQDNKFFFRKKRPFYFADSKVVNRPWKPNKHDEFDDEIIVGGQYAEPPARYVAKFPPHSPMYDDDEDEDTFNPLHGYVDTDVGLSSVNNSPYSNYKHSNMAFSPQNLNDAFSIVDK